MLLHTSVIVCTHNRAASLARTLASLGQLRIPAELKWELVVIDNNSGDDTKTVLSANVGQLPLRALSETRPGKSAALNRGTAESTGELLLFADDDVEVTPGWLEAYLEAADRFPHIDFFGGRLWPRWAASPPKWLEQNVSWLWPYPHVDKGEKELEFSRENPCTFPGANWAIRRSALPLPKPFREDIGPNGDQKSIWTNVRGEDTVLESQLYEQGQKSLYVPKALAYHWHEPHRYRESYLRKYYAAYAVQQVRMGKVKELGPRWAHVPVGQWRLLLQSFAKYIGCRWTRPSRIWLQAEIDWAWYWGCVCEYRRQARQKPTASAHES